MTLRHVAAAAIVAGLLIPATTGLARPAADPLEPFSFSRSEPHFELQSTVRRSMSAVPNAEMRTALVIDRAQSRVAFTVTKWGFLEVEGVFRDFGGTVVYDPQRPDASRIDWRVKVASVKTDEANRDQSLQQSEYFDAARFPELTFTSNRVAMLGPDELEVQGQITIKGRSRPLTVRVRHATENDARQQPLERFETDFTVNRYDFGVVGGTVLGPVISRDVRVRIVIAARAQ